MLSGSGRRGQTEAARVGGFWFHYQLIRLQQPSVAPLPLEHGGSVLLGPFGEKCHNSNGQQPFAFKRDIFVSTFNSIGGRSMLQCERARWSRKSESCDPPARSSTRAAG